jgi:glycosyltransferase involved in cell wall biosynthesis
MKAQSQNLSPDSKSDSSLACEPKALPSSADAASATNVRVAFFSDSLAERNGTGAYYHDLLGQLASEVGGVEIYQPMPRGRYPILALPMPGDPTQKLVTPNVFRIGKAYRALNPDIVVAITPGPFGLLGLYHARRSGAKFLTAFHTDFEQLARIYWKPWSRFICNGYLRAVNKFLCRRSETVLINNSDLRNDVEQLGAPNMQVMATPLAPAFLSRPLRPPPARVERICFAGRLAAEKNVDLIIEAAADFPQIEFVIVGDGPLRLKLEASAQTLDNVRFTGWLTRGELIDLLDGSSFLLLPSKLETFGSVALEAMARGRCALVSANAGIHDWPELKGGLVPFEHGESLASAIGELVQLSPEARADGAIAARTAAEQFNRKAIQQWVEVLARYANR